MKPNKKLIGRGLIPTRIERLVGALILKTQEASREMKVENALKVIQQEIVWSEKNPHEDESFKKGFIAGLKQAELLLTKMGR